MFRPLIYSVALVFFFLSGSLWTAYADSCFSFIGALFCLFAWLDYMVNFRRPLEFFLSHLLLGLALLGIIMVSFLRGEGYQPWYLALRYLALWSLFVLWSQKEHPISFSALVRIFSTVVISLFALYIVTSANGSSFGLFPFVQDGNQRVALSFGNPNYLGAFLVLCLPLFVVHAVVSWKDPQNPGLLMAFTALATGVLIILTGSRNALFLGLLSLLVCGIYIYRVKSGRWWTRWHWIASGAIFALLPLWAATIGSNTYGKILAMLSGGGASEMGRLTVWTVAIEQWSSSVASLLFGRGLGVMYPLSMQWSSMDLVFGLNVSGNKHVHSEYLECLLEGGLTTFFLVVAAFVFIFWKLYLRWRGAAAPTDKLLHFGFLCSIVSIAAFALISVATRYFVVLLPIVLLFGTMARHVEPRIRFSYKYSVLISIVLCVCTFAFCYEAGRVFRSDYFLRIATEQISNDEPAWKFLQQSVGAHPGRIHPRYYQFMELTASEDPEREQEVEACFKELEQIIPNYKNVREMYAFYLASTGRFSQAADLILELSEVRFYKVDYLCDAMFYQQVSGNVRGFDETCYELMYRVLRAEQTSKNSKIRAVRKDQGMVEYQLVEAEEENSSKIFKPGRIASTIPIPVRMNRPILKYYVLAQVYLFMQDEIGIQTDPRIFDFLSIEDRERVHQLAEKLLKIRESAK